MKKISAYGTGVAIAALTLVLTNGCATKKYVRSQTEPVIQKTNELDQATARNQQSIQSVDTRSQEGIQQAQNLANQASQNAQNATQAANEAQQSAEQAVHRADTLQGVIANLENYQQLAKVSVHFGFNKSYLTREAQGRLDQFGSQLSGTKNYILEVTGGTDSTGPKQYNYQLSDRRAMAVVRYLASKYNVSPRRFYLVGLGKDVEVASNHTAAGRRENRRVEVQLLSNNGGQPQTAQTSAMTPGPSPQQ
jgi:outer membrane protein OmpA-like peptidoglycan-associated protein